MSTKIHNVNFSDNASSDGWDEMYKEHEDYEKELKKAEEGK